MNYRLLQRDLSLRIIRISPYICCVIDRNNQLQEVLYQFNSESIPWINVFDHGHQERHSPLHLVLLLRTCSLCDEQLEWRRESGKQQMAMPKLQFVDLSSLTATATTLSFFDGRASSGFLNVRPQVQANQAAYAESTESTGFGYCILYLDRVFNADVPVESFKLQASSPVALYLYGSSLVP
jgi:hypothetical protein